MKTQWLVLWLALALTSCDTVHGIIRTAKVSTVPAPDKVEMAIRSVPGIDSVSYRSSEGSRPITLHGIQKAEEVHTFIYQGGTNIHGTVLFIRDYTGRIEFTQLLLRMNRSPPQEWLDATHPLMRPIESAIESRCGLTGLATSVVERCLGVKCE